jgi:hypothetical protein
VLPRHVYLRTVGQLLDVALEDLIASFEKLEDISEEETHHLHELLSLLLDCSSFFTATAAADEGGGSEGEGEGGQAVLAESGREEETKRHARRWSKFVKIVNMLESKLVVIVDAYVKGSNLASIALCPATVAKVFSPPPFTPSLRSCLARVLSRSNA